MKRKPYLYREAIPQIHAREYVVILYGNSSLGKTELVREIAKKL